MAYVAPADAEPGTIVEVEIRDQRVPARSSHPSPFYRRLSAETPSGPGTHPEEASSMVPTDLRYTKDHEWFASKATRRRSASPSTPPTSSATSSSSSLAAGSSLDQFATSRRRVGQGGERPVSAVGGDVTGANDELTGNPELVNSDVGAGWMLAYESPTPPSSTSCSHLTPTTP